MKGGKMNARLKKAKETLNEILHEEYLRRKRELDAYLASLEKKGRT